MDTAGKKFKEICYFSEFVLPDGHWTWFCRAPPPALVEETLNAATTRLNRFVIKGPIKMIW